MNKKAIQHIKVKSMKQSVWSLIVVAGMAVIPWAQGQTSEAQLLAVLKTDAPQREKADACRELARVGTQAAVAPLAALLGDAQLAHMARYALESIPTPAVDDALRSAAGQLKGRLLVGVVNSIGVRRDEKAVEPLTKFLANDDAEVAAAAALSLGKIGTPKAAAALVKALPKLPAAADGCFRCAETALAQGRHDDAIALYDHVRAASVPRHVQMAALRGAILARGPAGVGLLMEQLKSDDPAMFSVALRVAHELPGTDVTRALAAELSKLATDKQVLLIQALGDRMDAAAVPALVAAAGSGQPAAIRLAAIPALAQVGNISALPLLTEAAVADDADVAKAAQAALAGFADRMADASIVGLLNKPDAKARRIGIELIGRRRIAGALSELLRLAMDNDSQVCAASCKVLGDLGGANEIPALLTVLQKTQAAPAVENALASICTRQMMTGAGPIALDPVFAAYAQAQGATKLALLRTLRAIGGTKALAVVRAAFAGSDVELRETALRALCDWPTTDALPDLEKLVQSAPEPKFKILALRGFVRLVPLQDVTPAAKVAALKQALGWAERDEERRLVLASLGAVPSADALTLVASFLGETSLQAEARVAAVNIAEQIAPAQPVMVGEILRRVLKTNSNDDLAKRARKILGQIKKAAPQPK